MGKVVAGNALIALALFMLLGFFTADLSIGARVITFLVLVVLPAVAGGLLVRSYFRGKGDSRERMEQLRRQTQEAEILRLAREKGGKLTVADVVTQTALDADTVEDRLMSLTTQGFAEIDPSESGSIVYSFSGLDAARDKEADSDNPNA